jgi:hypothetical protein
MIVIAIYKCSVFLTISVSCNPEGTLCELIYDEELQGYVITTYFKMGRKEDPIEQPKV